MMRKINAVYEGGVLRPLESLDVEPAGNALADCIGTLPDEDAAEMRRIVESEFEQVNLREW